MKSKGEPLVVTTAHRGVFFGYGKRSDGPTIELADCRMCIYWSSDQHGVMGLASDGPNGNARISPKVPKMLLRDVTSVMSATDKAAKAWDSEPWK